MLPDEIRQEVDELTGLLKDNLQKVVQHGKRADSIVKNMLLDSREGSGEHRPSISTPCWMRVSTSPFTAPAPKNRSWMSLSSAISTRGRDDRGVPAGHHAGVAEFDLNGTYAVPSARPSVVVPALSRLTRNHQG